MANRASSVNLTDSGISREIGTQYANVKTVAENMQAVLTVAQMDFEEIIESLENAADFSGITVVSGEEAGWNSATKVITVPTVKGDQGLKGDKGDKGDTGDAGANGINGVNGASAYQAAILNGFVGTEPEWLLSLVGPTGPSGSDGVDGEDGSSVTITSITHLGDGVFNWSFSDGFNYTTPSLIGPAGNAGTDGTNGSDGLSAYQVAVANGFVGSETAWLASLVGPAGTNGTNGVDGTDGINGVDGTNGTDGASAYEIALSNGFVGTEIEWLASLNGADGPQGIQGIQGEQGPQGLQGVQGEQGIQGEPGEAGLSAYEIALANGFIGTEAEWLESLVGEPGGGTPSSVNNVTYQWDFLNSTNNADIWSGGAMSSGSAAASAGVMISSNHPGVLRLGSAATIGSGYRFVSGSNNANGGLLISNGVKFTAIFAAPGGTTKSYIGMHNTNTSAEPSTGAYIHVQGLTITAKTAQGGSSSSVVLGTISADTFYVATVEANFTGGFVFEIRDTAGTLVYTATIATTLPTAITGCGIVSYTTAATSQACAYIDYMRLQVPALVRG